MKLEQQVCNIELAKQLKELGVKQESLFLWVDSEIAVMNINSIPSLSIYMDGGVSLWDNPEDECRFRHRPTIYSAFTVAELGEMLPPHSIPIRDLETDSKWLWIAEASKYDDKLRNWCDTEADARAKMLVYLIENRLITL